jgi:hypothetical protein
VRRLDVIGQGREPERDFRSFRASRLLRRWRLGGVLAVAVLAAIAVVVAANVTRHGAGTPGAGVAPGTGLGVTVPAESPAFSVCAPSTSACSTRIIVIHGVATRIVRAAR